MIRTAHVQQQAMTIDPAELEIRRRAARRTSLVLAVVAIAIYAIFMLSAGLK